MSKDLMLIHIMKKVEILEDLITAHILGEDRRVDPEIARAIAGIFSQEKGAEPEQEKPAEPEQPAGKPVLAVASEQPAGKPVLAVVPENPPKADQDEERRSFLKNALREAGVAFAAAARNTTLERLFKELQEKGTVSKEQQAQEIIKDTQEKKAVETSALPGDDVPAADKEQVRKALTDLSLAKGRNAGIDVLREIGGDVRLDNVDPAKYAAIIGACRKKMVE